MPWMRQNRHWHWHDFTNERARCGARPPMFGPWASDVSLYVVERAACGMCRKTLTPAERAAALRAPVAVVARDGAVGESV